MDKDLSFVKKTMHKISGNSQPVEKFAQAQTLKSRIGMIKERTKHQGPQIRKTLERAIAGKPLTNIDKEILQNGWPELFGMPTRPFLTPKLFLLHTNINPDFAGKKLDHLERENLAMLITGADYDDVILAIYKAERGQKLSKKDLDIIEAGWLDIGIPQKYIKPPVAR